MSKSRKKKLLLIGILIIAIITLAPLLKIGIVVADDLCTLLMAKRNYWEYAYLNATYQGRFFFLLTTWFGFLPYFFDSIIWTKFLQFLPIIFIFIGFNKIIAHYFNKQKAGLLFLLIFFVFFQLTTNYNIFICYHFYFTTAFASLVWGFIHYQLYFENNNKKNLYISYFLFAFGLLFYEIHIVYSFFYFSLAFAYVNIKNISLFNRIKKAIYLFKGYFLIILIYIVLMIFWSLLHPSNYIGNQFTGNFSFARYFTTVVKFINGALPLNNFFGGFRFFADRSQDIGGFNPSIFMFSDTLSVSNYLKLLLIPIIFIPFIKISKKITFSKLYWGMIYGLLLIVLPALLLSLSTKYIAYQMEHYTITVFQFFGSALFFMCIFLWFDKKLTRIIWAKILSRVLILIFLLYSSLAHDFANNMYANDLKQSQGRLAFIDEFMKTDYYDKIWTQTIIFAPTLWVSHSHEAYGVTEQGFNWSSYSNLIIKKDRIILRNKDEFVNYCKTNTTDDYFYSFILKQAYQTNDFMLIASKINKEQINNEIFIADTADIFIYSNNNKGILTYNTILPQTDYSSITNKYHSYSFSKESLIKKIWQIRIINTNINIQSINISFMD